VTPRKKKLSVKKTAPALHRQMSSTSLASSMGSVSSTSTVFGVGLSMLSLSTRSQCSEDAAGNAEDDDLDLSLFEGSSSGGTTRITTTLFEDEDEEEYANFHNSLMGNKRNSITQILDSDGTPSRKKNPAPQVPKNIGHRRRPKLGDISWRSEEVFAEDDVPMIVEVSSRDFLLAPKPSEGSDEEDEFGFVETKKQEVQLEVFKEVVELESIENDDKSLHVDDLDLDLDMFSMTKDPDDEPQHVSDGGKGLLINTNIY
jgi:hypothetical protein